MFVESPDKSCDAFNQLCSQLLARSPRPALLDESYDSVNAIRTAILVYAKNAMQLDDRLMMQCSGGSGDSRADNSGDDPVVHYGTFSLIISNGAVPDQLPHVDVQPPNFQFGLIVTNNSPATRMYKSIRPIIRTPANLAAFLRVEVLVNDDNGDDYDAPASKVDATLAHFPKSTKLLQAFSLCLSTLNKNDYTLVTHSKAWDKAASNINCMLTS
jgi:hypothetical protein